MQHRTRAVVAASTAGLMVALTPTLAHAASPSGSIEAPSTKVVTAAPDVTRPTSRRCTVTLANHFMSNSPTGAAQNFSGTFTPPASCRGAWSKVVLDSTTSVSGRQYDRSGSLTIGGAVVWFGTTQEPSGATPTTYHFAKDVTAFSSLFRRPQPFSGGIVNYTSSVYTGNYDQTVTLTFYMADRHNPAARDVPDAVVGVPVADLSPTTRTRTVTLPSLPRNIVRAELQTTLKGNGCDEQWFTAVPDAVASQFPDAGLCGSNPYREARVSVDTHPVGSVGTFPHIYSGGIVPTLWRPVLAIDTLDMRPENLDITPLAGPLSDGRTHQLTVAMDAIGDTWNVTTNLFLYTDHHRARTTGALVRDTAGAPRDTTTTSPISDGSVHYRQAVTNHSLLTGWVNTSAGRIVTTVDTSRHFTNTGTVSGKGLVQQVNQRDVMSSSVTSTIGRRVVRSSRLRESYPIAISSSAAAYVDDQNFTLEGSVDMSQVVASTSTVGRIRTTRGWDWNVTSYGVLSRANGVTSTSDGHSVTSFVGTDDAGRPHWRRISTNHGAVVLDLGR